MRHLLWPKKQNATARKGQIEFIVIIILLAIGVATISYAVFTTSPDIFVGPQTPKTVKDTILNFISEAGYDTLQTMSLYGGYLGPQENYVFFARQHGTPVVNYYYYEGETYYPTEQELEANLVSGVSDYIRRYKTSLEKSLEREGVELGEASVQAKIHENKVVLTVNMPTVVKNQSVPQPYQVELVTRFGEIYEFAKDLVALQKEQKVFETFTIAEMAASPMKKGEKSVPLFIPPQFDCNPIYIGWNDMKGRVEDSITRMIQHTRISGDSRKGGISYTFPPVNGKGGQTLKVNFFTPTSFRLGKEDFNFKATPGDVINVIKVDPKSMEYLPERCYSDPLFVTYNIRYPVIVVIEGDITKDSFRFVLDVIVRDYDLEGEVSEAGDIGFDDGTENELCKNMKCEATITVKDSKGNALSSAQISFGGCPLGETNGNGVFSGVAPCILGVLEVSKGGYMPHSEFQSIDELKEGAEVQLYKKVKTTFFIHVVPVHKEGDNYTVSLSEVRYLAGETAQLFITKVGKGVDYEPFVTEKLAVFDMDPGIYSGLSAVLFSNQEKSKTLGGFVTGKITYIIVTDASNTFHVYIPRVVGFDIESYGDLEALYHLMDKCGYGPVLESEAQVSYDCSYKIVEVEGE